MSMRSISRTMLSIFSRPRRPYLLWRREWRSGLPLSQSCIQTLTTRIQRGVPRHSGVLELKGRKYYLVDQSLTTGATSSPKSYSNHTRPYRSSYQLSPPALCNGRGPFLKKRSPSLELHSKRSRISSKRRTERSAISLFGRWDTAQCERCRVTYGALQHTSGELERCHETLGRGLHCTSLHHKVDGTLSTVVECRCIEEAGTGQTERFPSIVLPH